MSGRVGRFAEAGSNETSIVIATSSEIRFKKIFTRNNGRILHTKVSGRVGKVLTVLLHDHEEAGERV